MISQSSGTGRGRGWLNLNKNAPTRPGKPLSPEINGVDLQQQPQQQLPNISSVSISPGGGQQYAKLISGINQLNSSDDGIVLNRKLKFIIETWSQECTTAEDVKASIDYIYQKCLEDEIFSTKVMSMVSVQSFNVVKICQQKIRGLFISKMQQTFDSAKELQSKNSQHFRNSVRLLSELYHRARLSDGKPIKFLATPLLCYFDMLLSSAQPADLELFTTLLYLNGSCIKNDYAQKLSELMNNVRQLLICNVDLTQTCKVYLLLAIDIANNRYSLLPPDVNKFYQDQLGDVVMSHFQGSLGMLSIKTQQASKVLDSYQSNVNVLQVTPPDSTSPINEQQATPKFNCNNNFTSETTTTTTNLNAYWVNGSSNNTGREKPGRPILGAGARLQKSKKEDANWQNQSKENSSTVRKQKISKGHGKGWEHDDRFDDV